MPIAIPVLDVDREQTCAIPEQIIVYIFMQIIPPYLKYIIVLYLDADYLAEAVSRMILPIHYIIFLIRLIALPAPIKSNWQ